MDSVPSTPLLSSETQSLVWTNSPFTYPGMVRIATPGDGSCFFHGIAKAYSVPYKLGVLDGVPIDRGQFIRNLRRDLSLKLAEPASNGKTYYELLGKGEVAKLGKEDPTYSLKNLQSLLDSNRQVGYEFLEFVSNILNKDIYVLSEPHRDVYITGDTSETSTLYRGRPSIVLLSLGNHFELVGIREPAGIRTLFPPNHPFITAIQNRLRLGNLRLPTSPPISTVSLPLTASSASFASSASSASSNASFTPVESRHKEMHVSRTA